MTHISLVLTSAFSQNSFISAYMSIMSPLHHYMVLVIPTDEDPQIKTFRPLT